MKPFNPMSDTDQLSPLEKDVLRVFVKASAPLSQAQLSDELGVSQSTISRHVSKMVKMGVIEKSGQTKGAVFVLAPKIKYWSVPSHRRAPVMFSRQRFDDYIPNVTKWLSEEMRAKMALSSPPPQIDASTYSRSIAERFLIDLSWASSSLEGNTYSLLETESLLKYGETGDNKNILETTMILNHKRAIELMFEQVSHTDFYPEMIQKMHALMMRDLLDYKMLGKVRHSGVRISNSCYIPSDNQKELSSCLAELTHKASRIHDPYEAMFFIMSGISYLQPFEDGNKRMGRLLGSLPLLRAGLPPISFVGINKKDYIQGLIEFYELEEKETLSFALSQAYVDAAHVYSHSTSGARTPKSAELRFRQQINSVMKTIIDHEIFDEKKIQDLVDKELGKISGSSSLVEVLDVVKNYVSDLNESNAVLWDVSDDNLKKYLKNRPEIFSPQQLTLSLKIKR